MATTPAPKAKDADRDDKGLKPIHVSRGHLVAARALIELRGDTKNVDALTAKIATATPRSSLTQEFAASVRTVRH